MTETPHIFINRTDEHPEGVKVLAWAPDKNAPARARTWPLIGKQFAEIEAKGHPGSYVWRPSTTTSAWFLRLA